MLVAEEQLLSIREVAKRLNVSDETVRRMINAGDLRATKVRFQWRIYADSVSDYLTRRERRDDDNN